LVKPNYAFAKRQRDLAKQRRKEEKRKRKADPGNPPPLATDPQLPASEKDVEKESGVS
jgi:hypothetical protein